MAAHPHELTHMCTCMIYLSPVAVQQVRYQTAGDGVKPVAPASAPPSSSPLLSTLRALRQSRAAWGRLMPCQRFTPAIWAVSVLMNHLAKASLLWKIYWKHTGQIFILKQQVEEPLGGWSGRWRRCGKKNGIRTWAVDEAIELVGGDHSVVLVQLLGSLWSSKKLLNIF